MTIEELIQEFPECEKIKREDIAEFITKAMTDEKFYEEATEKIWEKAHELWPNEQELEREDPKRVAHRLYFYGDYSGNESILHKWLTTFETEFITTHGQVHTFDEACQIVADEWTSMIFGNHLQDNGDQSEAGFLGMMLGTLAKDKARSGLGNEIVEKFRTLCKDYYLGGCIYVDEKFGKMKLVPYSDYGPNSALGWLLEQAGVPHDRIGNIAPWKTGITINKRDNSACVGSYQKQKYL